MADKRIIQLPDTPGVNTASDEMVVDNATDGTRRIPVGRAGGPAVLDANGMPLTAAGVPVVESGSNANGNYVKLADGTLVCYHTLAVTGLDITYAAGAWYRNSGGTIVWTYPQAFVSTPVVNIGLLVGNTLDVIPGPLSASSDQSSASIILLASQSHNSVDITLLLTAIGRWA